MNAVSFAKTLAKSYQEKHAGTSPDQLTVQTLLYYLQKESLLRFNRTAFDDPIMAYANGPVILSVKDMFENGNLDTPADETPTPMENALVDIVMAQYDSNRIPIPLLNLLSLQDVCWNMARIGIPNIEDGNSEIELDDLWIDVSREHALRLIHIPFVKNCKYEVLMTTTEPDGTVTQEHFIPCSDGLYIDTDYHFAVTFLENFWENMLNDAIDPFEDIYGDETASTIVEELCFHEDDRALITWSDNKTVAFDLCCHPVSD